jgi:two-component system nitrate/nitrite response regulator NarL
LIRVRVEASSAVLQAGLEALLRANGAFDVVGQVPGLPHDVVVTDHEPDEPVAGPVVIVHSTADAEDLAAGVEAAAGGLTVLQPGQQRRVPAVEAGEALTVREREVLAMLAEGAGNKAIAWKLGISEHTVKFHVAAIMGKLQAGSRTEAVTIGIRRGLILL